MLSCFCYFLSYYVYRKVYFFECFYLKIVWYYFVLGVLVNDFDFLVLKFYVEES